MSVALSTRRPGLRAGRTLLSLSLATGLTAAPVGQAFASGLDSPLVSSGQSGPTAADAAAVYWNPAELGFVDRAQVLLGAGLIAGHVTYQRDRLGRYQTPDTLQFKTPIDPANIDASKTGAAPGVAATPLAPTGDLFVAIPASSKLTVGLGVYVPYAAALHFPDDGAQQWAIRQAFIVANYVTASAAYRVNQKLSLGLGLSYVGGLAELSKAQDFASLREFHDGLASKSINQPNDFGPNAPTEVRELRTLGRSISLKKALSNGFAFNLGVSYKPSRDLSFSLAYQHGTQMHYKGDFAINMDDPFFTKDLAAQGLKYKPLVKGDADLSFALPKRITAGAAYKMDDKLSFDGFISYVLYSAVDSFVVETSSPDLAQPKIGIGDHVRVVLPRRWNDTVWIEGSARYRLNDKMLVSGTIGYQSPASPDSTIDVASPDGHRLIGGVGGVLQVSDRVSLLGDLRIQGIIPRKVTTSDYDLGNGTYTLVIGALAGHLKVLF